MEFCDVLPTSINFHNNSFPFSVTTFFFYSLSLSNLFFSYFLNRTNSKASPSSHLFLVVSHALWLDFIYGSVQNEMAKKFHSQELKADRMVNGLRKEGKREFSRNCFSSWKCWIIATLSDRSSASNVSKFMAL